MRLTAATGSKLAIYAAIAANVAIAVTKLVVASITGSSAMLSELGYDNAEGALQGAHVSCEDPERPRRSPFAVSPLGWEHIHLTGDYLWRSSAKVDARKFRDVDFPGEAAGALCRRCGGAP